MSFIFITKKRAIVTSDGVFHPITRDSPTSEVWTCHNRECNIHLTCEDSCGKCGQTVQ